MWRHYITTVCYTFLASERNVFFRISLVRFVTGTICFVNPSDIFLLNVFILEPKLSIQLSISVSLIFTLLNIVMKGPFNPYPVMSQ